MNRDNYFSRGARSVGNLLRAIKGDSRFLRTVRDSDKFDLSRIVINFNGKIIEFFLIIKYFEKPRFSFQYDYILAE